MRVLNTATTAVIVSLLHYGMAFAPTATTRSYHHQWGSRAITSSASVPPLRSAVEEATEVATETTSTDTDVAQQQQKFAFIAAPDEEIVELEAAKSKTKTNSKVVTPLTSTEVKTRLETQLEKLRIKDSTSPSLTKTQIDVVFEDEHVIAVNKPAGQLCVPNKHGYANLAQSVADAYGCGEFPADRPDRMVVHRLGMDTSGLVVLCKTLDAVRGMNTIFRTRSIERKYEALVCGHIAQDVGLIHLPLMRDYEYPPYMRVSTPQHQNALVDLDPDIVGKKLLEGPKDSLTKFEVVSRETLGPDAIPVTRVSLSSISGRTHQLNVHMEAFGHPIVGDSTYGIHGEAAVNGGLTDDELDSLIPNPARASIQLQQQIAAVATSPCIHAKSLKFIHPVTKEPVDVSMDAPF